MDILEKISLYLNRVLVWIGAFFLGAMIFMTCANIFLRIFKIPLSGTFELMGYFGAVLTALALGYTQIHRGHIAVDVLVLNFPMRLRRWLDSVNCLLCMAFFIVVAWKLWNYAGNLWATGEVTETLRIVYFPFTYAVAVGCGVLALVFLIELLKNIFKKEDKK